MDTEKSRNDWHSAFAGGLSLSFRAYKNDIEIIRELLLTELPPKIDALLIKKKHDVVLDNDMGRAFKEFNVIEYKNPNDTLNIDVVYKVIGYAAYLKGNGRTLNAIPAQELTMTILRSAKPIKLFKNWTVEGKKLQILFRECTISKVS